MHTLAQIAEEAKQYGIHLISEFPERVVYHNIKFANRYLGYVEKISNEIQLSEEKQYLAKIGAWLICSSFDKVKVKFKKGAPDSNITKEILKNSAVFFEAHPLENKHQTIIEDALKGAFYPNIPTTLIGKIFADAITADFVLDNGQKHFKKFYEELLLNDVNLSKSKWYDIAINLSNEMKFHLPYCQEHFNPQLDELILGLSKEKKKLEKSTDLALKKEMNISDAELKELKKNLKESKGRDARGIQTIFRTVTKNHYTLNEMVDRKASIMITVNSIILSLVLGGVIGNVGAEGPPEISRQNLPIITLALTSIFSIIFAIISIRPDTSHGKFTEEEIRNKGGNLLFFGNFHNMRERDFEWAFLQMMNDQDYMYSTMIKDLYHLGQVLDKKYRAIRLALTIFLVGLILSVVVFLGCFVL